MKKESAQAANHLSGMAQHPDRHCSIPEFFATEGGNGEKHAMFSRFEGSKGFRQI